MWVLQISPQNNPTFAILGSFLVEQTHPHHSTSLPIFCFFQATFVYVALASSPSIMADLGAPKRPRGDFFPLTKPLTKRITLNKLSLWFLFADLWKLFRLVKIRVIIPRFIGLFQVFKFVVWRDMSKVCRSGSFHTSLDFHFSLLRTFT